MKRFRFHEVLEGSFVGLSIQTLSDAFFGIVCSGVAPFLATGSSRTKGPCKSGLEVSSPM